MLIAASQGRLRSVPELDVVDDIRPRSKEEAPYLALMGFHHDVQQWALAAITVPYDNARLRNLDIEIGCIPRLSTIDRDILRRFIRAFGRKDRKRPRDKLLRDRSTRDIVMNVREKTAFMGYTWRRMRPDDLDDPHQEDTGWVEDMTTAVDTRPAFEPQTKNREEYVGVGFDGAMRGYGGFGGWGDDVVALKALHRGRMSLH